MPEPTRDDFEAALRHAGLEPAGQDPALYDAWIKLRRLMKRLRDPARPADAHPQSIFNVSRLQARATTTPKDNLMSGIQSLQTQSESDPEQIHHLYDDWAGAYDADLAAWGYAAPAVSVAHLEELTPTNALVLDVGCGTGLVGQALAGAGFGDVVGIDFSADSLRIAQARDVYRSVQQVDLTELPTPLPTAGFEALICVGVMSYLPDVEATCREFCRVLKPGSPIVLTQRSDLFESRNTQAAFDALTSERLWEQLTVTGKQDYLPANPDFDGIGVRYCEFRTLP